MNEVTIIYPDQLYPRHPGIKKDRCVYIIEDPIFFYGVSGDLVLHKKKILFHKLTIRDYASRLSKDGYAVKILGHDECSKKDFYSNFFSTNKIDKAVLCRLNNHELEKKLDSKSRDSGIRIEYLDSPGFFLSRKEITALLGQKDHYSLTSIYIKIRKKTGILIEKEKPAGGKWSFDTKNRKKLPRDISIPEIPKVRINKKDLDDAIRVIDRDFSGGYGDYNGMVFPVDSRAAEVWLQDFLANRFELFGPYQDAISRNGDFLFHSLLSPLLNTGILTPRKVVDKVIEYSKDNRIPINSLEGFIRQVIGWREFIRGVYLIKGDQQKKLNTFGNTSRITRAFYKATTGIKPVDDVIDRTIKNSYAHHIERLMVIGNFMMLCEIAPTDIYRWFSELFIDAYDWVMIPNVFGLSQYADGGLMSTKPYISSSNYILKMSDYGKSHWSGIWDSLFWRFVYRKKQLLEDNPRMKFVLYNLDRMDEDLLRKHLDKADGFLEKLI